MLKIKNINDLEEYAINNKATFLSVDHAECRVLLEGLKLIEHKRVNLLPKIKPLKSALEEIEIELFDNSIKDSNNHYTIATELESRSNQYCASGRCDD
tara:strand:+ start:6052 stop:6345 length:294 start_codon:yes stop_codon:yes gene_type:complete